MLSMSMPSPLLRVGVSTAAESFGASEILLLSCWEGHFPRCGTPSVPVDSLFPPRSFSLSSDRLTLFLPRFSSAALRLCDEELRTAGSLAVDGVTPSVRSEVSPSSTSPLVLSSSDALALSLIKLCRLRTIPKRLPWRGLFWKLAMERKEGVFGSLEADAGAEDTGGMALLALLFFGMRVCDEGCESVIRSTTSVSRFPMAEPGAGGPFSSCAHESACSPSGEGERAVARSRLPASVFPLLPSLPPDSSRSGVFFGCALPLRPE